jgi:hypothetical protein
MRCSCYVDIKISIHERQASTDLVDGIMLVDAPVLVDACVPVDASLLANTAAWFSLAAVSIRIALHTASICGRDSAEGCQHCVIKSHTESEGSMTEGLIPTGRDGRSPWITRCIIWYRLVTSWRGSTPECIYWNS